MKIILNILFSFFLISLTAITSLAFDVGTKETYWLPGRVADTLAYSSPEADTDIYFKSDLGLNDENTGLLNFYISGDKHNLELSYASFDYSGRNILIDGQLLTPGDEMNSSMVFSMMDIYYIYDFINVDNIITKFELGGAFQLKYLDGEVRITTSGANKKSKFSIPAPLVGLNLKMGMMSDALQANVRGTGIAYSEDNLYELMGEVSWTPLPSVNVYGGYKAFAINVEADDIGLDYNLSGPYAAIELSF